MEEQLDRHSTVRLAARLHKDAVSLDGQPLEEHLSRVADLAYSFLHSHIFDYSVYAPTSEKLRMDYIWHAAYLHESTERVGLAFDDLANLTNIDVARLVTTITPDNRLPSPLRWRQYPAEIGNASFDSQLLKLADLRDVYAMCSIMMKRPTEAKTAVVQPALQQLESITTGFTQLIRYPRFLSEIKTLVKQSNLLDDACVAYNRQCTIHRRLRANVKTSKNKKNTK